VPNNVRAFDWLAYTQTLGSIPSTREKLNEINEAEEKT
jgi:hypothetical protein